MEKLIPQDLLPAKFRKLSEAYLCLEVIHEDDFVNFVVENANARFFTLLGVEAETIISKNLTSLCNADQSGINQWFLAIEKLIYQEETISTFFRWEEQNFTIKCQYVEDSHLHVFISPDLTFDNNVVDNMPLPYQSLDELGNILDVNKAWCHLLGYTKGEVVGKKFTSFIKEDQQGKFFIFFPKLKKKKQIEKLEFDLSTKDQKNISVEIDTKIISGVNGQPVAINCFLNNISLEKKQEESKLKLLKEQELLQMAAHKLLACKNVNEIFEYLGKVLFTKYPNSLIIVNPVVDQKLQLGSVLGINSFVMQKLEKQLGYSLYNKELQVDPTLNHIFKNGNLSIYQGSLVQYFDHIGLDPLTARFLNRLYKINKIFLRGIIKDGKLLGAISIFTVGDSTISDKHFIESLIQSAAVMIDSKNNQKIIESNQWFLDNLIDHLPLGLQLFSKQGISLKMNHRQAQMLHLKNKYEGINKFNIFKDSPSPLFYQEVFNEKITKSREIRANDYTYINFPEVDQNLFFNETVFPIVDKNSEVQYLVSLLDDITKKKKTENILQENEQRLGLAFEGSGDGFWDWKITTNEVVYSEGWKSMLGYKPGEISNSLDEWSSRVHPEDLTQTMKAVQDHIDSKTTYYNNEHRMRCKDGSYKWILDRGKVINRDKSGNALRMIGTHSDITQRKTMENALKISEENYRTLIASMNDGVTLQNKNGEIITCNDAALQILGLTKSQITGRTSKDPSWRAVKENGKDFPGEEHPAMQTLKTGMPQEKFIMGIHKPDGSLTWISVNSEPMFLEGAHSPSHVVATFFDITAMKKNEQKLKKVKRELQQLNNTKDQLFNIIGHDLKSPFNQITELSKLVQKSLKEENYKEIDGYIQLIKQAASGGQVLLSNLLEWSRIKTQKKSIKKEKFNLAALVNEAINIFLADLFRKKITIETKYDPEEEVYANKNMVNTIIRNLISNAIKFSFPDSKIKLEIINEEKSKIKVEVTDYGVGIKAENIANLFDTNKIYSTKGTNQEKGSGLGLVLCKEFVERHGGELMVKSDFNKGSSFSFRLPKANVK